MPPKSIIAFSLLVGLTACHTSNNDDWTTQEDFTSDGWIIPTDRNGGHSLEPQDRNSDLRAWPANLPEKFQSSDYGFELGEKVNWTVDKGARIVETGSSSAKNRSHISVVYLSPSDPAYEGGTVSIKAAKPIH